MAMNYDVMNELEMDSSDSRKRPLDTETENGVTKRSNQGGGENVHLKILVPSIAAGAIIGKGGETIAQIQKEAGARVKMSKANDFYPGTTERVCLIMGAVDAVRKVHVFIMEKIREKPDPNPKLDEAKSNFERHRQVKILVPNSTAGMIIGKGGNFIKQIKEDSGAYVQISQKSKETNLPERCVTVAGEPDANKKAVDMILQKIVEDPQSGSCPNISYADYTGPVASANPTGSPFANTSFAQNRNQEMAMSTNNYPSGAFGFGYNSNAGFSNNIGSGLTNLNINNAMQSTGGSMNSGAIESLRISLRTSGFSDQATDEISSAMNTLATYGVLGMGLGVGNVPSIGASSVAGGMNAQPTIANAPPTTANSVNNNASYLNTTGNTSANSATGSLFGPVGSGSSGLGSGGSGTNSSLFGNTPNMGTERYGGSPMLNDTFANTANYNVTSTPTFSQLTPAVADRSPNITQNQNSFGLGTDMYSPTNDKSSAAKQELDVPENIVGAILGPGGKGIVELQQYTQTNIQISKKGVYVPGTRNRIVTITGITANITKAQYLIQQRIQQEEIKRARQASGR